MNPKSHGTVLFALLVAFLVGVAATPGSAHAEELTESQRLSLEEDRAEYRLLKGLSVAGLVVSSGITAGSIYGLTRGARACEPDEFASDCRSRQTLSVMYGSMGISLGLSGLTASVITLAISNSKLRTIEHRLSFGFEPRPDGGYAVFDIRF